MYKKPLVYSVLLLLFIMSACQEASTTQYAPVVANQPTITTRSSVTTPTHTPVIRQSTPIVQHTPFGYNFTPGTLIYAPPADFCAYFACIKSFNRGKGYVEECQDGMFSKSGGIRGSCSSHGGDYRPLYAH